MNQSDFATVTASIIDELSIIATALQSSQCTPEIVEAAGNKLIDLKHQLGNVFDEIDRAEFMQ